MSMRRALRLIRSYTRPVDLDAISRETAAHITNDAGAREMTGQWSYLSLDVGSLEFDQLREVLARYEGQGWQVAPRQPASSERGGLVVLLRRERKGAVA